MKLNYLTVEIRALLAASLIVPNFAFALPQGGNVVAGQADIKNVNSTYMTIDQKSNRAVVNWDSFNVGKNDWVDIRQQKSSDALLNRVTGNNLSEIAGKITAKGQVFIVNPNGITFKNGSIVNVGSLVASTADIENAAFMQGGKLEFNKKSNKKDAAITIENGAYIDVGQLEQNGQKIDNPNGFAAFIAPQIKQGGFITAQLGTIHLAAGEAFTLDVGGGLLNILLGDSDLQTLGIENTGTILSKGGLIRLQAASINNLLQGFITQNGQLIASEFTQDVQGNIQLTAPKGQVLLNASEIKTGSSAIVAEKSQLAANKIVLGDGVIYSTELAELKAKQDIQQSANQQIAATKQLSIASEQGNISLAGAIEAGQADIQAKQGKITTVKAENKGISSTTGDVTVTAKDADLNAFISAKNNLSVNTTNTLNIDAEAKAQKISLDSASILVQGKNSKLLAESTKDTALNIVGKTGVTLNGVSESKANTTIQSTAGSVVFSKDSQGLSSVGDLSITANQAELVAQLLSTGKNLSVTTTQDLTVSGKAKAQGMSLKSTQGSIKQSSTSVLDATNLTISSDTKDIELQGTSKVATDATLTAKGNITVSAVSKDQGIAVGNNLTVKGQNVVIGGDKSTPTVKAANLVEVKDTGNLALNNGVIEAKQIKLSAGNIQQELNQGIKAIDSVDLTATQTDIVLKGAIEAGQVTIKADSGKVNTVKAIDKGISSTTGNVTVTAKEADLKAFLSAKDNLTVKTTGLLNIDAEAKAQKISLDSDGTLTQGKNSKLLAESTKDTALNIVGKTGVTLNGVSESKANTTIQSTAGSVVFSKDSQGLSSVGDLSITANQAELVAQLLSTGKNLSVTTTQDLTVSGKAKAQGMSLKSTQGSIKQSSTSVLDATNLTISSDTKDIELQGTSKVATDATLTAKGNITVSAASKDQGIATGNNLTLKGQTVVIGGDKSAPTVKASNLVEVKDTGNLALNNGVIEAKQIKLSAGNIQQELNQGIKATDRVDLTATQTDILLKGAIEAGQATIKADSGKVNTVKTIDKGISSTIGNVTVTAKEADLKAFVSAKNNVNVATLGLLNIDANILAQAMTLESTAGSMTQTENSVLDATGSLTLKSQMDMALNGVSKAKADATLTSTQGTLQVAGGANKGIQANKINLDAKESSVTLAATVKADDSLIINAKKQVIFEQGISQAGKTLTVTAETIEQKAAHSLVVGSYFDNDVSKAFTGGDLVLTASGATIDLAGVTKSAKTDITAEQGTVKTVAATNNGIESTGHITVKAKNAQLGAILKSAADLNLNIAEQLGLNAEIQAQNITAKAKGIQQTGGRLYSDGLLDLAAQNQLELSGLNQAKSANLIAQNLTFISQAEKDKSGLKLLNGDLTVKAENVTLDGTVQLDQGKISVNGLQESTNAKTINLNGHIQVNGDLVFNADELIQQAKESEIQSSVGDLIFTANKGNLNLQGKAKAAKNIDLSAHAGKIDLAGELESTTGNITVTAKGDISQKKQGVEDYGKLVAKVDLFATPEEQAKQGKVILHSTEGNLDLGYIQAWQGIEATADQGSIYFNKAIGGEKTGYADPFKDVDALNKYLDEKVKTQLGAEIDTNSQKYKDKFLELYKETIQDKTIYKGYEDSARPDTGYLHAIAKNDIFVNGLNLDGSESQEGLKLSADRYIVSNNQIAVNKGDLIFGDATKGTVKIFVGDAIYSRGKHVNGLLSSDGKDHQFYNIVFKGDLVLFDNTLENAQSDFTEKGCQSLSDGSCEEGSEYFYTGSRGQAKIIIANNSNNYKSIKESASPLNFKPENTPKIRVEKEILGLDRKGAEGVLLKDQLYQKIQSGEIKITDQNKASQYTPQEVNVGKYYGDADGIFVKLISLSDAEYQHDNLKGMKTEDLGYVCNDPNICQVDYTNQLKGEENEITTRYINFFMQNNNVADSDWIFDGNNYGQSTTSKSDKGNSQTSFSNIGAINIKINPINLQTNVGGVTGTTGGVLGSASGSATVGSGGNLTGVSGSISAGGNGSTSVGSGGNLTGVNGSVSAGVNGSTSVNTNTNTSQPTIDNGRFNTNPSNNGGSNNGGSNNGGSNNGGSNNGGSNNGGSNNGGSNNGGSNNGGSNNGGSNNGGSNNGGSNNGGSNNGGSNNGGNNNGGNNNGGNNNGGNNNGGSNNGGSNNGGSNNGGNNNGGSNNGGSNNTNGGGNNNDGDNGNNTTQTVRITEETAQTQLRVIPDACYVVGKSVVSESDLGRLNPLAGAAENTFGRIYTVAIPDGVTATQYMVDQLKPVDDGSDCAK